MKTTYEDYLQFIVERKKEIKETSLVKQLDPVSREMMVGGRLLIEVYDKFIKKNKKNKNNPSGS